MIYTLISLICLSAFVQPDWTRASAILIFGGVVATHAMVFANTAGFTYYVGAAMADLAVILLTSFYTKTPKLVLTLHKICLAFIGVNLIGWGMFYTYLPPYAYDVTCMLLYMYALITFTTGGEGYVRGGSGHSSWYVNFFIDNHPRANRNKTGGGEA